MSDSLFNDAQNFVRGIGAIYRDPFQRARRLFIEERAIALKNNREEEYKIKSQIAEYFNIDYSSVCFCGSAQLGFSVHKERAFLPKSSDLDVACVSPQLFQDAWQDVIESSNAFSNESSFSPSNKADIELFKDQIVKRGMIRVEVMPNSQKSMRWRNFETTMSKRYTSLFGKISFAIYINEYAFCWKQDSALSQIMKV